MRLRKATIWCLLSYLVLLWNLGPYAHFADQHADQTFLDSGESSLVLCTCGIPHHESAPNSPVEFRGQHDCSFCDFFDDFQIVLTPILSNVGQEPICGMVVFRDQSERLDIIRVLARGPPVWAPSLFV